MINHIAHFSFTNDKSATITTNNLIRKEIASSRPNHLPKLSAAKVSNLSLLVKHHMIFL